MVFINDIVYNLGIGLGENFYNFGCSWFFCFDNFVEWFIFDLNIISVNGCSVYCSGDFIEEVVLDDECICCLYCIS